MTWRFGISALLAITLISTVSATFLSRLLAEQIIRHDAEEVMQFVRSFVAPAVSAGYFDDFSARERHDPLVRPVLERISAMPDVIHVNVYDLQRRVLWSTERSMIGRRLPLNHELDSALEGELESESSLMEDGAYLKPEHLFLLNGPHEFVETYVPILSDSGESVVGVVEIYRRPRALFAMAAELLRGVWLSAAGGGGFLFVVIFWLARRADSLIRAQHEKLVHIETFAAIGEMSAAVAHSIRNPLASIRSSAELGQELEPEGTRAALREIVAHVDRIASWITQMLVYAQPGGVMQVVDAGEVLRRTTAELQRDCERAGIAISVLAPEGLPMAAGDPVALGQVFTTVMCNAIEAMPHGGRLDVSVMAGSHGSRLEVIISDTGVGIAPMHLERLFVPFQTTKKSGLGVGLPLVRRVLERMGGSIRVRSRQGRGTVVCLSLATRKLP
ncbi:MAG: two-component sensor histidine kinase [Betaproteobacteria bacterium]|nr:two-component sensor histidine kinase [Betaproteobacteria bacterium]